MYPGSTQVPQALRVEILSYTLSVLCQNLSARAHSVLARDLQVLSDFSLIFLVLSPLPI